MTGRRQDPVWGKFRKIVRGTNIRAQCLNCKIEMCSIVSRMKSHHEMCMLSCKKS